MMKKIRMLVILLIVIFNVVNFVNRTPFPKANATYVEGPIVQDTVWTLVDSPFVISNNVTVYPDVTLTIEAGVQVRFGGDFSLTILGKLYANGTDKHIIFTSNRELPQVGDWQAIKFNGVEKSLLINCVVSYSKFGLSVENGDLEIRSSNISYCEIGIVAINSKLLVYDCTISFCSQAGVDVTDSECTIQKSTMQENQADGIRITGNRQVNIQESVILANKNGILLTGNESSNVNISQNRITVNSQTGIKIDSATHSNMIIINNIITSNNEGIHVSTPTSTQITNNTVIYNKIGILYDAGNHEAHFNDIYGNEWGMNVASLGTVNAEQNYWGDPSGPYHESLNPEGRGNRVGGNGVDLDFIFFLTQPIGYFNARPTAILLADKLLVPPDGEVMFFATNSFDDGRVDMYFFDFGDGSNSSWTTLSVFTHKYSLPIENCNVSLTVMDDWGITSEITIITINVRSLLPSLQATVDLNTSRVHEGEQVSVMVHVADATTAMENATVTLFAVKGGSFSEQTGVTDVNGDFNTTFTAPDVLKMTNVRIVARVSKDGYADGSDFEYLEVLPFLSVQIIATPSIIKSEGTSQISIYVKSNDAPVVNASVTITCTVGSLSSNSGVTDFNGAVALVFTAPQTVNFLNAIITAVATKDGYMNGIGETTIVIEPKILFVQVTTSTGVTLSEAKVNVTVHVEYEGIPISDANVVVSAGNGTFSVTAGSTDNYGNVTFVYTAPPVGQQTNITIVAQATKNRYAMGQGQSTVTVNPRTFSIQISMPNLESAETANVVVTVTCKEDSTSVSNALVTISCTYGDFTETVKTTSATGTCTFTYNAPQTSTDLLVTITVNVTKNGYVNGGSQAEILVSPKASQEGGWSLITMLLIIIPVVIAVIIVVLIKLKIIVISAGEEEE